MGSFYSSVANAACLAGDVSKQCIGVYKVPIDDSISEMVGTKEALARNAPGLNYVPPVKVPKSYKDAIEILYTQRNVADAAKDDISNGKLEEAGITVLGLVPKVTTAGRVVIRNLQQQSSTAAQARAQFIEDKFNYMLGSYGECDIMIGQGLRGEMGVSAAAQLNIMKQIQEANASLDDFLQSIPRDESR